MKVRPTPTCVKALRGFLGLTGYYRRFVKHYGIISKPLNLIKKRGLFQWSKEVEEAFQALKRAMSSTGVLALPNFAKPLVLEIDAHANGV